ncbi:Secretin receptor [Dufourea novaeangliae]|uniref:Secretin receptor n=1 Tax=Dufourea novaeangliae TaxID=178035 RepID=A0A154PMB4_DUFNO|nr:Secretin receptor [Dufourea novaeangliae]
MPSNSTAGSTLLDEDLRRILIEREQDCLQLQAMNSTPPPEPYCRITFDGWSCWPNTPAGATAYAPCPNFITGFDASLMAHKYCEPNGTWFRHPMSDQVWSKAMYNPTNIAINVTCRLVHIILHYFLLTNYAWMLCEGFYLHTLLVSAFTSEHKLVKWLMALGWPMPAIIVTLYACLRALSDDPADTEQCWINEGNYMNVLVYPVCVSTLLNLLFLSNIVRVLLMKLRAGPTIGTQPSRSMRQAFRATLLLVPLLGLHYLLTPFRPPKNHPWEQFYEVLSAITASFQGLCVAILFCFCNGEVIAQFKRKWEGTALLRNRANSCTATTVSNKTTNEVARMYREREREDEKASESCPCRASDATCPESSPLWDVDCFSLSARPQVRWRERRRCDYRSSAPLEHTDAKLVDSRQTVQLVAVNNLSNHTRLLVKSKDSLTLAEQTQC